MKRQLTDTGRRSAAVSPSSRKPHFQRVGPVVVVADRKVAELIDDSPRSPIAGVEAQAMLRERRAQTADPQQLTVKIGR